MKVLFLLVAFCAGLSSLSYAGAGQVASHMIPKTGVVCDKDHKNHAAFDSASKSSKGQKKGSETIGVD